MEDMKMSKIIKKSLLLLIFAVVICCVIYPLALLAVGQVFFPFQANGSIINGPDGKACRLLVDCAAFYKGRVFPTPPVCRFV